MNLGLDTETYGTSASDRLFSIAISSSSSSDYYNFHDGADLHGDLSPLADFPIDQLEAGIPKLTDPSVRWYIHNAKFDWQKLKKEGADLAGRVICTNVLARLQYNQHMNYSLDACAKRFGWEKDDGVEKSISYHKLYTQQEIPGKKGRKKKKHFEQVPYHILEKYAKSDSQLHLDVGLRLETLMMDYDQRVVDNEMNLIEVLVDMQEVGIKIDREYCELMVDSELDMAAEAKLEFKEYCGVPYLNGGRKALVTAFESIGQEYPRTPKGNPCFDKAALDKIEGRIGKIIRKIRHHEKMASTYYSSFIYFANNEDVIQASFNQAGTFTGRFSSSDPNLQNIPKEEAGEEDAAKVRRAFVPRKDYCFVMMDYDQQEFRMMLDYAGETEVISQINDGMDVHEATAQMMGVSRTLAKTLNFGLLYGMGRQKLAEALKVSMVEAQKLKNLYFKRLPNVRNFIQTVTAVGEQRGWVHTWLGRRLYLPNKDRKMSYKLVNHLIQGGGADVIKVAMVRAHDILRPMKSRIVLTVHDEIVFEIHKDELDVVPKLKDIMQDVYEPKNGLRLTCGVDHSWKSWASSDKIEGMPWL